jgi:YfiH family protein
MIARYIAVEWPAPTRVHARMTTRFGGASAGPYDSFNLATHCGDDLAAVEANRAALSRDGAPPIAWLEQIHGADVVDAADLRGVPRADASFARRPGIGCAVLVADCLPVLICDRAATVVAAVHCGWRGLARGVLTATVRRLGTRPQQLMAWLGPAIGQRRYEVGDDVRDAFVGTRPHAADAFVPAAAANKWCADLSALARSELAALGVDAIYGGGFCTFDERRFYSYRRDGTTGRMAALIWLSEAG